MDEAFQVTRFINTAFGIIWILIHFAAAGLAFYRFRTTASGLLCGGAFLLYAFKAIAFRVYFSLIMPHVAAGPAYHQVPEVLSYLLGFVLTLLLIAGVALIPRSLRILSEKS